MRRNRLPLRFTLESAVGSQKSAKALRVRHEITGTIGRDDFGASQGAKSTHTGSMEAMSDASGAQKRPALRGGPSLARGGVAPRSHSPARLPHRALPRSQIWASQLYRIFRDGPLARLAQYTKVSSPLRVRARITSPVWVLRHLSGKARGLRILLVWKGRATPPDGMDRRPNRGSYSCASPKVTTTFCIAPCTPKSYTSVLRPTAVSRFNVLGLDTRLTPLTTRDSI